MAAVFAELLPWLIMRYLGEISYAEDQASRERTGLSSAVLPSKAESNPCSTLCFPWAADREPKIILGDKIVLLAFQWPLDSLLEQSSEPELRRTLGSAELSVVTVFGRLAE